MAVDLRQELKNKPRILEFINVGQQALEDTYEDYMLYTTLKLTKEMGLRFNDGDSPLGLDRINGLEPLFEDEALPEPLQLICPWPSVTSELPPTEIEVKMAG